MKTKKSRATQSYPSAKGKALGGNPEAKTRQRLPSEAFARDLQTTPLPRVPKSPLQKGVFQPPRRQRTEQSPRRRDTELLFNSVLEKYTTPYNPAPTQVGGTREVSKPLNSTDLRKSKEIICKNRQTRREVLFALGKAGKGSNVKEAKWTLASLVRCD